MEQKVSQSKPEDSNEEDTEDEKQKQKKLRKLEDKKYAKLKKDVEEELVPKKEGRERMIEKVSSQFTIRHFLLLHVVFDTFDTLMLYLTR